MYMYCKHLPGFYLGFFCLGEKIGVEIDGGQGVCSRRALFSRGSGGMPPQKTFKFLSLLRVILRHFKTVLRS